MSSEREQALEDARNQILRELLEQIVNGSWTPGIHDKIAFEKLTELESRQNNE